MSVSETCADLLRQCDELSHDLEAERHHRRAIEESEKALAAHVCQVNEAWRVADASLEECVLNEESLGYWLDEHGYEELSEAFERHPAISLAHRDAEMKARALEEAAMHTTPAMHQMAEWLRARARWIRKHGTEAGI